MDKSDHEAWIRQELPKFTPANYRQLRAAHESIRPYLTDEEWRQSAQIELLRRVDALYAGRTI